MNNRKVLVYRHGNWLYTTWRKVKVGDIVKVIDKEFFPADIVLLSSGFVQLNFLLNKFFLYFKFLVNHNQYVISKHLISMEKQISKFDRFVFFRNKNNI